MTKRKTANVLIYLPDQATKRRFRQAAKLRGVSLSEMVREALEWAIRHDMYAQTTERKLPNDYEANL